MKSLLVKVILKIVSVILTILSSQMSFSQDWSRVTVLPEKEFTCVKVFSGKIYALSENKLFTSVDGENWIEETITTDVITPISLEIFNNQLYVGTFFNGVFEKSMLPNSNWNQFLNGVAISSFVIHNNELYLSTFGVGVYKKNVSGWQNFNFNFPTFSYNVSKLLSINNILYAFAGGNGTYYTFNATTQLWDYHYFFENIAPGFITDDALLTSSGTVYVARGNALLRSNNLTQNWIYDAVGLINGNNRILYEGANSIYVLTLYFNENEGINYTRIQTRDKNAAGSVPWSSDSELQEFYTYSICEFGNKIFAATDLGLYYKTDTSLGIENPLPTSVKVYPNPSLTPDINFSSESQIDEVIIYDLQGRQVYRNHFYDKMGTIQLNTKGVFIATFLSSDKIIEPTKIIMN